MSRMFVDTELSGRWQRADADNPENALSRTGYLIFYADFPVVCISKLKTEIALSTVDTKYITLSQATQEVIPLIQLLTKIGCIYPEPIIRCKVSEDNKSCIAIAKSQKFSSRTRHITIKFHNFHHYTKNQSSQWNWRIGP